MSAPGWKGDINRQVTEARKEPIAAPSPAPEGRELALLCARLLDERRARDIVVFDVGQIVQIANVFIVATGGAPRHVKRTADYVIKRLKELGVRPLGIEGYDRARWVLFDYGDVVVHLMVEEARSFYNLELLWSDCPRIPWIEEKA